VRALSDCHLYGIVDLGYVEKANAPYVTEAMIAGGVDLIQLRGKQTTIDELTELAATLHNITSASAVPLIVNDHPEVACRVALEGVHVGQDDQLVESVRKTVDRSIWVGKSTHSLDQATAAEREGADYIGFGPIFSTPTKPDYLPIGLEYIETVHQTVNVPVFCIGGIKRENLRQVLDAGAQRVVIVSGLVQATDISVYARRCKHLLSADSHLSSSVS
jgi:thiamine-phosphate pyrophosphorylase